MSNPSRSDCDQSAADLTRLVARSQCDWAAQRGIVADQGDLTVDLDANLFSPLSRATREELLASRPALLGDGEKVGEMSALCSTAALVHNVFEYWRGHTAAPIERACGSTRGEHALELCFAARVSAHPGGLHSGSFGPPADVMLKTESQPTVVAASFLEPYWPVDNRPSAEFLDATTAWSGLRGCLNLAADLRCNPQRFRHLAVTRLLGLGRDWTRELGERGFRLLYLWYDGGGPAAERIRAEIDRFRMRAGGELNFAARSWQEFVCDLRDTLRHDAKDDQHAAYTDYLSHRYFRSRPSA